MTQVDALSLINGAASHETNAGQPPYEPCPKLAVLTKGLAASGYVDRCARRVLVIAGTASCRNQSSVRFQFLQQVGRAELNQGLIVRREGPLL